MKKFEQLTGRQRRSNLRMLRLIHRQIAKFSHSTHTWVRGEVSFRMVERLHRAGLLTAAASKSNWMGSGRRPFRELAIYFDEALARKDYPHSVLTRK